MKTRVRWVAGLAVCALVITPAIGAGPWYVATNGVDSGHDGLSWGQAFATISNAVAQASSGTIYVSNGVYVLSTTITNNKALTIEGVNGWSNTVVDGNASVRCFHVNHASAVLRGLTITNGNMMGAWNLGMGGGVRLLAGKLDNCQIVNNSADFKGGGVYVGYGADVGGGVSTAITNCRILNNRSNKGGGVGLWAGGAASYNLTIDNSDICSNVATGDSPYGAGVFFQGATLAIRNSRISGNVFTNMTTGVGWGIGVGMTTPLTSALIENCQICDNSKSDGYITYGGGLYAAGSNIVIRGCLIAGNRMSFLGGGFFVKGAGVYVATANANNVIESCTIAGNYANFWRQPGVDPVYLGGSGIYMVGNGADVVRNCVIYTNTGLPDLYFENLARTNNVYFTCVNPTNLVLGGLGNITNNPQFVNAATGDYRLARSSPCLNIGSNVAWMSTAVDLDGNPRLDGGIALNGVDMGCYEYVFAKGTLILMR